MSIYESIRVSAADSISNLELKHLQILSGQNICQFNRELMEIKFSSLFFEAYYKICVIY